MALPAQASQFLRSATLDRASVESFDDYPFSIPVVRDLQRIDFHPQVTFLIGENGTGKSTLLEALAIAIGLNPEGGGRNHGFATRPTESVLWKHLRIARGVRRPRDQFFLRAESYFNVATEFDALFEADPDPFRQQKFLELWGGIRPHEQSHGESFYALMNSRFQGDGLYLLDEPESALSPLRQLAFLTWLDDFTTKRNSQFVIATHSPLILAFPRARILACDETGLRKVDYADTEHVRVTRDFFANTERYLAELLPSQRASRSLPLE